MRNTKLMTALLLATALLGACAKPTMETSEPTAPVAAKTIYDFKLKDIDGKEVKLEKFKGKVLVVVNVASKCGLTPQYAGLEKLYQEYKGKGVVVLGFPANNFGGQEPGTEAEIKTFCSSTYNVTFPMFSKISVKGDDTAPLYQWLLANSDRPKEDVEWNFAKFVIGKDGKLYKRLSPRDTPESPAVREAIDGALKA